MRLIGYLCSEFPALSHTFISREITVLRRAGFDIRIASVNETRNASSLAPADRAFLAETYCLKATPTPTILAALMRRATRPARFLRGLRYALSLAAESGPRDVRKALGYFVEAALLCDWARAGGVKHLHVHFANPAATAALIAARMDGLSVSLSVHGPDEFYDVERNCLRQKIEAAAFVRCISYYSRSQLQRLSSTEHWAKFHIVRCGIYHDEFPMRPPKAGPARSVLCVGRLCPSKGQAVLVAAAALLRDRGRDFHITLLGGGEELESVRRAVAGLELGSFITVAGPVGHEEVKRALAACDLFVLPSFAEGVPVSLMEAMAAGVPVISTNVMGIPELIEDGKSGILTRPSDADQLADAVDAFLLGTVDVPGMVEAAAAAVRARYDVEANTLALGRLFDSLGDGA